MPQVLRSNFAWLYTVTMVYPPHSRDRVIHDPFLYQQSLYMTATPLAITIAIYPRDTEECAIRHLGFGDPLHARNTLGSKPHTGVATSLRPLPTYREGTVAYASVRAINLSGEILHLLGYPCIPLHIFIKRSGRPRARSLFEATEVGAPVNGDRPNNKAASEAPETRPHLLLATTIETNLRPTTATTYAYSRSPQACSARKSRHAHEHVLRHPGLPAWWRSATLDFSCVFKSYGSLGNAKTKAAMTSHATAKIGSLTAIVLCKPASWQRRVICSCAKLTPAYRPVVTRSVPTTSLKMFSSLTSTSAYAKGCKRNRKLFCATAMQSR